MAGLRERVTSLFYRMAVSGALPVKWFRDVDPATVKKDKRTGTLSLEIVCHCWRYGHFLNYQLSSLVNHRTDKLEITMTVFHVAEDEVVTRVLREFSTNNWVETSRGKVKILDRKGLSHVRT